jgi:hypothetical protein
MVAEVYDALREAGASEEKARRAAEAMTGYDERFARIEGAMAGVDARLTVLDGRLAGLSSEVASLRWMVGVIAALQIAILVKQFIH